VATQLAFTRLDGGKWGVRAQGGADSRGLAGQKVDVRKRDGSKRTVTLGTIVSTSAYKSRLTTIYTIDNGAKAPAVAPVGFDEMDDREAMNAEYQAGVSEVAQIQAISLPGSAYREMLYMEMEQRNYNLGLDG
jgi:hypothetical protein